MSETPAAAVRIVPFEPALAADFRRLNVAWLERWFSVEPIDEVVLGAPEREIVAPGGAILFARVGDAVVGTCALRCERDGVYELTKMAVEEAWQGRGIGRRLLEAAIDEYRRRGGTVLFLESNSRLGPALHLYEALGFEHQPARRPDSHYARSDVYMVWHERPARA